MGKHLKRLRAEKAKIKLKKKLPKGQNVTNTAFKVKKIIIAEQLPDHAGVPVTTKHQTLQECLNYLTHHNVAKQIDGLRGIKEIFRSNFHVGSGLELRKVVTRVLDAAVEDKEGKVRRTSIKLLTEILTSLPGKTRAPFIELLNKQLQRGLSNINSGIQRDSLRLLDLVMTITQSESLNRRPLLTLLLRMLTMTGATAPPRVDVLKRLLSTCEAVFSLPARTDAKFRDVSHKERPGLLTCVFRRVAPITLGENTECEASVDEQRTMIDRVMRTSVGVWTEISPDDQLSSNILPMLSLLVRLTLLLYQFAAQETEYPGLKSWFVDSFRELVGRNLLAQFPYHCVAADQKTTRQPDYMDKQGELPANLMDLNLNLATLYMHLQPKNDLLPRINDFLPSVISLRPVSSELSVLLEVMLRVRGLQVRVVRLTVSSCLQQPDDRLSEFLRGVALDEQFKQCHELPEFRKWVISKIKDPKYSDMIGALVSRGDEYLAPALHDAIPYILQTEPMNKPLLHALYWVCSPLELLSAEEASPQVRKYLTIFARV